jgi:hypothetical protein
VQAWGHGKEEEQEVEEDEDGRKVHLRQTFYIYLPKQTLAIQRKRRHIMKNRTLFSKLERNY